MTETPAPRGDFDFWVGDWDVHQTANNEFVGRNSIIALHGGHVLAESYSTETGFSGSSLNAFDRLQDRWHQCWMDCTGLVLDLSGGLSDGAMVMDGQLVTGERERITWTPGDDDTVRQHWQQSTDDGATWETVFDGTYRRR